MANLTREWRTVPILLAWCDTCGKQWETANAHGVAARHARAHNHHTVVEKTIVYSYDHTPNGGFIREETNDPETD